MTTDADPEQQSDEEPADSDQSAAQSDEQTAEQSDMLQPAEEPQQAAQESGEQPTDESEQATEQPSQAPEPADEESDKGDGGPEEGTQQSPAKGALNAKRQTMRDLIAKWMPTSLNNPRVPDGETQDLMATAVGQKRAANNPSRKRMLADIP
jgi:hypothetical protein